MIEVLHDTMSRLKSAGSMVGMTWTGNKGKDVGRRRRSPKWHHIGKQRVRVMKKLDESKTKWIIHKNGKCMPCGMIAKSMGIPVRRVQGLCRRYSGMPIYRISYPEALGRPRKSLPGALGHTLGSLRRVQQCRLLGEENRANRRNAYSAQRHTCDIEGRRHCRGVVQKEQAPQVDPVRAAHSNSMWHTDYMQLDDGRWFICYLVDASRFVTAWGGISGGYHGECHSRTGGGHQALRQACLDNMTIHHGSQFYANGAEARKRGESAYEKMVDLGIR